MLVSVTVLLSFNTSIGRWRRRVDHPRDELRTGRPTPFVRVPALTSALRT